MRGSIERWPRDKGGRKLDLIPKLLSQLYRTDYLIYKSDWSIVIPIRAVIPRHDICAPVPRISISVQSGQIREREAVNLLSREPDALMSVTFEGL